MRKLMRRPSPAMIVASLALLVALSGTGVAAVSVVGRNSVGTLQLRDDAVSRPKIRNNAINSAKVAARSLLRSDFAPGQLPAGPTGPQGPAGPAGSAVRGRSRPRRRDRRDHGAAADGLDPGSRARLREGSVTSQCSGNERAISGGTHWSDDNPPTSS